MPSAASPGEVPLGARPRVFGHEVSLADVAVVSGLDPRPIPEIPEFFRFGPRGSTQGKEMDLPPRKVFERLGSGLFRSPRPVGDGQPSRYVRHARGAGRSLYWWRGGLAPGKRSAGGRTVEVRAATKTEIWRCPVGFGNAGERIYIRFRKYFTRRMYLGQSQYFPGSVWQEMPPPYPGQPGTCLWPMMCWRSRGTPYFLER